ncbi:cobalamin-binding protein [Thermaerobacter subterraneus]|uniref:ABC-type Fe3+-hydroxamate transport system, periplasmic component n=1 Tax=Thermaerobacter subterraneus DSM 13965 TaxID=867903 RepID=K6Q360_9FIRM|nr:cobalamin-binding protein [Thermaerobacter subterraneus]EKP95703.1 ABC-type Fe3+-hydroxamate transport system, periplasmic component [Thermaerobacter subterraneus DSM 13965]
MRIVSLAPSNTEIAFALGLGEFVVGVDDHSDYPPEVARLPRVGPDLTVDIDRVAALEPDLVLASLSVPGMERNVEALQRRGLPHLVLNPQRWPEVLQSIQAVAAATGREERGRRLVRQLQARAAAVRQRMARLAARRGRPWRLYLEWWPRPLITPGRRSWFTDMAEMAGGQNIFADLDRTSGVVEPEAVVARVPDVILLCWCGTLQGHMDPSRVAARPGWSRLEAVARGRVVPLPEALFGRPGPRLVEGLERLAGLLAGFVQEEAGEGGPGEDGSSGSAAVPPGR